MCLLRCHSIVFTYHFQYVLRTEAYNGIPTTFINFHTSLLDKMSRESNKKKKKIRIVKSTFSCCKEKKNAYKMYESNTKFFGCEVTIIVVMKIGRKNRPS